MEFTKEKYELVGGKTCDKVLKDFPSYKVFWRSGFAYRGACEMQDDKKDHDETGLWLYPKITTFEMRMKRRYDWAAAIDIVIDHEKKEIHFNGFSSNDLY